MLRQDQALQVATMLYTAFGDYEAGADDVADQLLVIAQAIETNELTPRRHRPRRLCTGTRRALRRRAAGA